MGNKDFQKFVLENIKEEKICFIPLFSGLSPRESMQYPENVQRFIWSGETNKVLRNKILEMSEKKGGHFNLLKNIIKDIFEIELEPMKKDANLQSYYSEKLADVSQREAALDVFAGGSGFQQILHLLVYILSSEADIILVDEPDAHLHFDLQKKMFQALRQISLESKKQIILATHSFEIIHEGIEHGDTKIFFIDKTSKHQVEIGERSELAKNLYENGIISAKTLQNFTDKMTFLVVENELDGKDIVKQFFTKKFPEISKDSLFEIIDGRGNGKKVEFFLAEKGYRDKQKITRIFLRDADGLMEEEKEKIIVFEKEGDTKKIIYINDFEVENWLLNPAIIARLINKRKQNEGLFEIKEEKIKKLLETIFEEFKNDRAKSRLLENKIFGKFQSHRSVLLSGRNDEDFGREAQDIAGKRADAILAGNFEEKLKSMPGKEVFKLLKQRISESEKIQISEADVAEEFLAEEIPLELDIVKELYLKL